MKPRSLNWPKRFTNMPKRLLFFLAAGLATVFQNACVPQLQGNLPRNRSLPASYGQTPADSSQQSGRTPWRTWFKDPALVSLIDSALVNNQEFNIAQQEIILSQNEARARRGEYLPFVGVQAGAGVEKVGRYTRAGATEANLDIKPGTPHPEPVPDFLVGAYASWEVDIWRKLRNSRQAAVSRYMSSREGRNFLSTQLVAEIASSYYELLALDNELVILKQNIQIQTNALETVRLQKEATRVTELAVRRFEAQLLNTKEKQFDIEQRIIETENRIHFLTGTYPGRPVARNSQSFPDLKPDTVFAGVPVQLLQNRPDVRQAEWNLTAARLDVKAARANFYPSLRLSSSVGFNAYDPKLLFEAPESMLFGLAGELTAPLINRVSIKAQYANANARQIQAVYDYQRTVLRAFIEVYNQLAMMRNMAQSYSLKQGEVRALTQSIDISNNLFGSARADYMEVLLTQRDAQESRFQLVEIKMRQLVAWVQVYKALGGGWQ